MKVPANGARLFRRLFFTCFHLGLSCFSTPSYGTSNMFWCETIRGHMVAGSSETASHGTVDAVRRIRTPDLWAGGAIHGLKFLTRGNTNVLSAATFIFTPTSVSAPSSIRFRHIPVVHFTFNGRSVATNAAGSNDVLPATWNPIKLPGNLSYRKILNAQTNTI